MTTDDDLADDESTENPEVPEGSEGSEGSEGMIDEDAIERFGRDLDDAEVAARALEEDEVAETGTYPRCPRHPSKAGLSGAAWSGGARKRSVTVPCGHDTHVYAHAPGQIAATAAPKDGAGGR